MQMLAGLYLFASQMYFLCGTAGLVQYSTVQSELVITKRMVVWAEQGRGWVYGVGVGRGGVFEMNDLFSCTDWYHFLCKN